MINFLAVLIAVLSLPVALSYGAQWKPEDMNPGGLKPPPEAKFITPDCDGTPCGYDIHYFTSQPSNPGGKPTILYISGGPGQIVNRKQPDLKGLEAKFHIVYFDVRGAGLSAPQKAVNNSTDRFLRAEFVVKDIEEIRKKILVDKPWDAIYGHSAGTMFAQMYAKQFGESRVKTLILSAPISRHIDNEPFRAAMIATNLKNILENNTDQECPWKQPASSVIGGMLDRLTRATEKAKAFLLSLLFGGDEDDVEKFLKSTNNFCFLDSTRIDNIRATLERKLNLIIDPRRYGSISFVLENHKDLANDDSQFQMEFPYPEKFFVALRTLGRLGSPKQKDTDMDVNARSFQVNAALVVGYYLDSPTPQDERSEDCNPKAQFFTTLFPDIADIYCRRFQGAAEAASSADFRSARAANVLGIHEGIHRWPVRLMGGPAQGCNRGNQFLAFANSSASDKRTARKLTARVGFQTGDEICAWNPAKHRHNVPSLILKGSQDAAIHACQAEHFFKEGLLNTNKVLVEFPDLGHDWISEIKPGKKGELSTLLEKFIKNPRGKEEVRTVIKGLGATSRTVASFAASGC